VITALEVYAMALDDGSRPLLARGRTGRVRTTAIGRWLGPLGVVDERALARVRGPVLDIGCGPGRHVGALARRGVLAVGVDVSAAAVTLARRRGAIAVHASVFDRVPGAGRWRSALLLDGNIGIGACPTLLLRRVTSLLAVAGDVLVELQPPGRGIVIEELRLEHGGACSGWFQWATVAVDAIGEPAAAAGLGVAESWGDGGRWFARLERR
jgi:SAM-dependent methyltransferase